MATPNKQGSKDAAKPYTVARAFYWGGEVAAVGSALQLTAADAAQLLAANKVVPGEPVKDKAAAKAETKQDKPAKEPTP